ncbi:unnamed protein product [Symbiodinium sp. CCMP2592]|nr:unnamed protein product [Symbiodinium sp. CCMP2592]
MAVTPLVQQEVDTVLARDLPLVSKWKLVESTLLSCGLAWKACIHPSMLLVHPLNRGGLGINGHSAHAKGASLLASGFDRKFLHSSTCFELAVDEKTRREQLQFNEAMVGQADGLLAAVSRSERFLTVSSGHVSQFAKAAWSSCRTPQPVLQDQGGCLNRESLSRDPEFKQMLDDGWNWLVVSSVAEHQWPDLPRLAEKALNASNTAFQSLLELEIALHMEELSKGMKDPTVEKLVKEACPPGSSGISRYAPSIAKWLAEYSDKGRFLAFLSLFSREFGEQCNVGEDFWGFAVSTQFLPADKPLVRLAFLTTQFTSPTHKISDGFARLLVKADFDKLKKLKAEVAKMESLLYQAWQATASQLPDLQAARRFAFACIRMTLHILGKQKMGREAKEFKDLDAIFDEFQQKTGPATSASSAAATSSTTGPGLVSLGQAYDPLWQAQQKLELAVGKLYQMDGEMYELQAMGQDFLTLKKRELFDESTIQVETWTCHKRLRPTKNSAPYLLDAALAKDHHPGAASKQQAAFATVYSQLLDVTTKVEHKNLWKMIAVDPVSRTAYSLQKIPAHQLTFVPCTDSPQQISIKKPEAKHWGEVVFQGVTYFVLAPKAFKPATAEKPSSGCTAPFWFMKPDANPHFGWKEKSVGGLQISCLSNPKAIDKHELLTMPVLQESEAEDPAASSGPGPKKKARK